jgi:hypothetical protein
MGSWEESIGHMWCVRGEARKKCVVIGRMVGMGESFREGNY